MGTFETDDGHEYEIYQDEEDRWRWRATARNGKIDNASEQSYASRDYARKKARKAARQYQ